MEDEVGGLSIVPEAIERSDDGTVVHVAEKGAERAGGAGAAVEGRVCCNRDEGKY